jgi:uncharacterized protein YneF (UPF0154 family)
VAIVVTSVLVVMGIGGGYVAERIYQAELEDMMEFLEQEI